MPKCKVCEKEFHRIVTNGRNDPSYCTRECYDKDHFIWANASKEQQLERLKMLYEKNVIRQEGCWDWKGYIARTGYAEIGRSKNFHEKNAHRISWMIHKGNIPEGMYICHKCDNPKCTNPDHLFIGTHQDNDKDRDEKGRNVKGEDVESSILKDQDIKEIKTLLTQGKSCLEISRKYDVSHDAIKRINKNETWKHIPWPTEIQGNGRDGPRKLSIQDVIEIKKLLKLGVPCSKLGRDYGVTKESINAIKNGKNWKHIKEE